MIYIPKHSSSWYETMHLNKLGNLPIIVNFPLYLDVAANVARTVVILRIT
jgi:hypothetical protein